MSDTRIVYFMYHHNIHCYSRVRPVVSKSPDSFTLFPCLPPELRLKIWQTVAAQPQTVELSCTPTSAYLPEGRWFSHNKPPVIFSICSDSRDVALREYSILTLSSEQEGMPWGLLYFNFAQDTLWLCSDLGSEWARDLLKKNELLKERLRFLSVAQTTWKSLNPTARSSHRSSNLLGSGEDEAGDAPVSGFLLALEGVEFH